MFELIPDLPDQVLGVRAIGELDDDYDDVRTFAVAELDAATSWIQT